jgi:hypothetical protein
LAAGTSRRTSPSVGVHWSRVAMPCRGSRRVAGLDCSLRDAWPSPRVVWACLSLPECLPSLPRPSLACGRVGDDGDVMVARLVRPASRLLPGQVACMAASCCFRVTWRFAPSRASVAMPESCVWAPRTSRSRTCRVRRRLVVRGRDLSCEAKTGSSSGKLVGDATTWPKTGRIAVRVMTKICMSSLRRNTRWRVLSFWMLQSARVHPFSSYLLVNRELHLEGHGFVVLRGIIFSSKMALIWALVSNGNKLEKKQRSQPIPFWPWYNQYIRCRWLRSMACIWSSETLETPMWMCYGTWMDRCARWCVPESELTRCQG